MDWEKRSFQVGAAVLCCAVLLRLWSGGLGIRLLEPKNRERLARTVLFLETGRWLPPAPVPTEPAPALPSGEAHTEPTVPVPEPARFSPEDADRVRVMAFCDYDYSVPALLSQPLEWDLQQGEPAVLVYHTHAAESYEKQEEYEEIEPYRTSDQRYSVVSVGAELSRQLEMRGISVLHDRTPHDLESYNESYEKSRLTVENALQAHPEICMALDLHRDAAEDKNGNQVVKSARIGGRTCAQIMLVVGTDASGWHHPNWQENFSLAVKLQAELEAIAPGICRPLCFRRQRFNQDLSPGALLVEIGTAGNTRQDALYSAEILAEAISRLAAGSLWEG